jgi:DNA-binding transcriptional LysR family regulator
MRNRRLFEGIVRGIATIEMPPNPVMDRARRLRAIWNYLPAFRAVAETEHLPTAAAAFHLSASALSRAMRMAETEAGSVLFERVGRGIRLTPAGHAFLGSVRDAMRLVDEGLGALGGADLVGSVVIAARADTATWLVAPALARLRQMEAALIGTLVALPAELTASLRRGDVDVVITDAAGGDNDFEVEALTTVPWSAYRAATGRGDRREIVAVAGAPSPIQRGMKVAAIVADATMAAAACRDGLLAWLPAPLAARYGLVRVPGAPREPQTIHAVWRHPVTAHRRTDAALAALRATVKADRRTQRARTD